MAMSRHITLIACIAAGLMPALASAQSWAEGAVMQLTTATAIEYGTDAKRVTKSVGPGAVACANATFGDPVPGVVKSCRVPERVACLPKPVGTGSAALAKSGTKGDFIAWYCQGAELPVIVACVKSACGLLGAKRAVAAVASNPTLQGVNEALKPFTLDPYTDASLVAVWAPYTAEIRALVP